MKLPLFSQFFLIALAFQAPWSHGADEIADNSREVETTIKNTAAYCQALSPYESLLIFKNKQDASVFEHGVTAEYMPAIEQHTKAPVSKAYFCRHKLHNISLSDRWQNKYHWNSLILRIHTDNKISGWPVSKKGDGSNYAKSPFKYITDLFLGAVAPNNTINFARVTKKGTEVSQEYERWRDLAFYADATVLYGLWEGDAENTNVHHQKGKSFFTLNNLNQELTFSMKEKWSDVGQLPERIANLLKEARDQKNPDIIPLNLSAAELQQLVSYYVLQAWTASEAKLPDELKNKKDVVCKHYYVCLKAAEPSKTPKDKITFKAGSKNTDMGTLNITYDLFIDLSDSDILSKISQTLFTPPS